MSDITNNIIPSNNDGGGPSRKRSRRSSSSCKSPSNDNKDGTNFYYRNISFHERTSTGRPGTPHRYFEHSYDVSFQDCVDDTTSLSSSRSAGAVHSDEKNVAAALTTTAAAAEKADTNNKQSNTASNNNPTGNQVVHRHVNGLCIITAGNILQTATLQRQISSNDNSQSQHQSIESIKYHVQVAPDAQSARGKLRAKNKKRKKNNNNNNHDSSQDSNCGDVSPTDTLCEVTLTNGDKVILKCCVQGTIIELNHRLLVDAADTSLVGQQQQQQQQQQQSNNGADVDNDKGKAGISDSCRSVVDGNASLLLTDPLLDGYLAVIMPNRGTQLPTL